MFGGGVESGILEAMAMLSSRSKSDGSEVEMLRMQYCFTVVSETKPDMSN